MQYKGGVKLREVHSRLWSSLRQNYLYLSINIIIDLTAAVFKVRDLRSYSKVCRDLQRRVDQTGWDGNRQRRLSCL